MTTKRAFVAGSSRTHAIRYVWSCSPIRPQMCPTACNEERDADLNYDHLSFAQAVTEARWDRRSDTFDEVDGCCVRLPSVPKYREEWESLSQRGKEYLRLPSFQRAAVFRHARRLSK